MNAPQSLFSHELLQASEAQALKNLQSRVVAALSVDLPSHALLYQSEDTVPYECDGLTRIRTPVRAV